MERNIGRYVPAHPHAGEFIENLTRPLVRAVGAALTFYDNKSHYAKLKGQEMRERLSRGESVYLLGICPSGHNSTAALAEVSAKNGILPICNNQEERYTGIRHEDRFPENSVREIFGLLEKKEINPTDILAVIGSWDYLAGIPTVLRVAVEEAPFSFQLARRAASPQMNLWHFLEALQAPSRFKEFFGTEKRVPVIGMRHHDNYNAYNYMVLTVKARPESFRLVPAVIHKDGTSRLQIVREETDPFSHAILKALGRRLGVEVAVNTSLNVGTPIVQTPAQAIKALHRSRGMTGLLLLGKNGKAYLVWHRIDSPPKDVGRRLLQWVQEWRETQKR